MENIKNEVLGTPVSKEVSAWHGAREGVQSPLHVAWVPVLLRRETQILLAPEL